MTEVSFTLGATIPVAQYANITPQFTITAPTLEEAKTKALAEMKDLFRAVNPRIDFGRTEETQNIEWETLTCVASGTEVRFDSKTHRYEGGPWMSGSKFADAFKPPFPAEQIAARMAEKTGGVVSADDIRAMWGKKGEASSSLGSAIHAALESYGKYLAVSRAVKDGSDAGCLHDNPMLRLPVVEFFSGRKEENALYEAFVCDVDTKRCGLIDRLLITGEKRARVQDFKTNTSLLKYQQVLDPFKGVVENTVLGCFWLQMSFYAWVLQRHGWVVEGLDVHHWNGLEWLTYSHGVVDLSEGFKVLEERA